MILFANRLHKDATFTGAVPGPSRAHRWNLPFYGKEGFRGAPIAWFSGQAGQPFGENYAARCLCGFSLASRRRCERDNCRNQAITLRTRSMSEMAMLRQL